MIYHKIGRTICLRIYNIVYEMCDNKFFRKSNKSTFIHYLLFQIPLLFSPLQDKKNKNKTIAILTIENRIMVYLFTNKTKLMLKLQILIIRHIYAIMIVHLVVQNPINHLIVLIIIFILILIYLIHLLIYHLKGILQIEVS